MAKEKQTPAATKTTKATKAAAVTPKAQKPSAAVRTKPAPAAKTVLAGTLGIGATFELDGDTFRVKTKEPTHITANKLEWASTGDYMVERWMRHVALDTEVIPK